MLFYVQYEPVLHPWHLSRVKSTHYGTHQALRFSERGRGSFRTWMK